MENVRVIVYDCERILTVDLFWPLALHAEIMEHEISELVLTRFLVQVALFGLGFGVFAPAPLLFFHAAHAAQAIHTHSYFRIGKLSFNY